MAEYRLIDADEHYYEPDDCFSRHIESRYAADTICVDRGKGDGLGRVYLGGKRKVLRANTACLLGIEAAEVVSSGAGRAPGR